MVSFITPLYFYCAIAVLPVPITIHLGKLIEIVKLCVKVENYLGIWFTFHSFS